ncbi:MAG: hypothetical protein AAB869_04320 [Patescibacteria group bacterium]
MVMGTARVTGKVVPIGHVHFVKCIEGHLAAFEISALLSADGAFCPFCNSPISLSSEDTAGVVTEEIHHALPRF